MPPLNIDASQGLVTSRDPATLKPGELVMATGCEYHVGSPHMHKQPGRDSLGATMGAAVLAINKCQYDSGTDKLVASAGGTVYESAVSTTPTFTSSGLTGLSSTVIPHFSSSQDRWLMCNGTDNNYIREPATVPISGWTTGAWRTNGMTPPSSKPTLTFNTGVSVNTYRPNANSSTGTNYTSPTLAYDSSLTTYAYASISTAGNSKVVTFTWAAQSLGASGYVLDIDHLSTTTSFFPTTITGGSATATHKIEVSIDAGVNYTTLFEKSGIYEQKTSSYALTNGFDLVNLRVRGTFTLDSGTYVTALGKLFDVRVSNGNATPVTATNSIFYGYTERYYDSDGEAHESILSDMTEATVANMTSVNSVTVAPGTKQTAHATHFAIYRSVDTPGGGYPNLYEVGEITVSETSWSDSFQLPITSTPDTKQLDTIDILYGDGSSSTIETNGAPPKASMAVPFMGCMTYLPADAALARRLPYSLPGSVSSAALEQVPDLYYLEFQSPKNDSIKSLTTTNGGKSLLAFFEDYTMIVNYLPQAGDGGVFDNRVKEYVSNSRGTAGRLTTCEFTLPTGTTLVASADALGLWVTNGINTMAEWSRDLDWTTDLDGVTLANAQLVDNPEMRRLEFLYTDADGNRAEYHFFYGQLKQDGDGQQAPKISGPHLAGVRCKHYTFVSGAVKGFSGDASTTGDIFLERAVDADDANGYDASGTVPYDVWTGDQYVTGLGGAHMVEFLYPKFASGTKSFTIDVTTTRDGGSARTTTKTFNAGTAKKLYIHRYGDRMSVRIRDYTATSAPAFVGMQVEVRDAGDGRDA